MKEGKGLLNRVFFSFQGKVVLLWAIFSIFNCWFKTLIALGYTMVYGIIRLINFAHGDFIMVGGYTLFFSIPVFMRLGLPGWLSVIFAIIICAVVGVLVELLAYRPVRKKGTNMTALITAIAMRLLLENLAQAIPAIGPNPKVMSQVFSGDGGITIGGVSLGTNTIITIIVSALVMLLLQLFVKKTKLGKAMRAVSEDKEAAIITGIISGAMLGGLAIGLIESFTTGYISSSYADAVVFLILIIVLIIKPAGILGKNIGEKV